MWARAVLCLIMPMAMLSACGMPRDPGGTFHRVRNGTMRVGITENPPWVLTRGERPSGIEPRLLQRLAQRLDAQIEWRIGSESALATALRNGELDVVAGGLTDSTPWSSHAGMTLPYVTAGQDRYVMIVRQGENRWLLELDRFLHDSRAEAARLAGPGA